ncbi:MAG: UxaA family hydrolase [Deltaproteobacteria bacterium]|nr:UxaA family hydrolase [Deltaproteobacteria bacterium]MBW1931492.1 UxaA family hydrolase [Deltaproteobacteria bacterium]MBW1978555.1 UxaA family hydrolase [Deltaproteobacteria bacterium]MBW2044869.1 UxaA family hydrolase [Deltaproteobacteria bacterium]
MVLGINKTRDFADMELSGYMRPDGSFGFRNHIAILCSVGCANDVALRLGRLYPETVVLTHRQGCAQLGGDKEQAARTLAGLGKNPNIAGVLVVGMGCESITAGYLADEISKTKKMVEFLVVLDEGGLMAALPKGARLLDHMVREASQMKRVPCGLERLTLGVKCGLTDTTSGIATNPAVGMVADRVVESGGRVIFGETPEIIGAEHILAKRAATQEVEKGVYRVVNECEERIKASGMDIRGANPAPGNITGGITTIEEKSLGAIKKGGGTTLQGVVAYGEIPEGKGLFFMDGPGRTPEALTGLSGAGAQIIIFTTGGGSPAGSLVSPVIKVTGNPRTAQRLSDHIDIDVSAITRGESTLEDGYEVIFRELIKVASGKATKSEALGCGMMSIWNIGSHM